MTEIARLRRIRITDVDRARYKEAWDAANATVLNVSGVERAFLWFFSTFVPAIVLWFVFGSFLLAMVLDAIIYGVCNAVLSFAFIVFGFFLVERIKRLRTLPALPPDERAENQEYAELFERAEAFNRRLQALQEFAARTGVEEQPGPDVVAKYAAERMELAERLKPFLRKNALENLRRAVEANVDGRYRSTIDVSDAVYVNRLRVSDAEPPHALKESTDEELFLELERTESERSS